MKKSLPFLLLLLFSLLATPASSHAQTNVLIDGTSGTNVIGTSFSNISSVNLSLGFFADYLLVGGGGGGGAANGANAGGGGGAQVVFGNNANFTAQNYAITVGAGGAGGIASSNSAATVGGVGGLSSVVGTNLSVTAGGGGGGAGSLGITGAGLVVANATTNGSSGGGGSSQSSTTILGAPGPGTAGQGNAGGAAVGAFPNASDQAGGGGGGAAAAGGAGSSSSGGAGGSGASNSITGSSVLYGGGGGGGKRQGGTAGSGGQGGGGAGGLNAAGTAGTANTGGGGGGAGDLSGNKLSGGAGGSGVVIVRYQGPSVGNVGGTVTSGTGTATGYSLHTFTSTGSNSFNLSGVDMNSRLGATITGNINAGMNLSVNGPGTVTLAGSNHATQDGQVSAGTLRLTGTLLNNRGFVAMQGGGPAAMVIDGGTWAGTDTNSGRMLVLSVGGASGGNGTLTLNSGSVSATTIYLGQATTAMNPGTGVATFNGGTITAQSIRVGNAGSGILNISGGSVLATNGNLTISGSSNGAGSVNVTGGLLSVASLSMSPVNTTNQPSGPSLLSISNGGTVEVRSMFTLGSGLPHAASNATVNLGPGGTLRMGASSQLTLGTAGLDVLGTLEFVGTNGVVRGGPLRIGNGGTNGVLLGNLTMQMVGTTPSSVTFNRAGELTYAGNLRGAAPLIKEGSGTLTLLGTNTYNGAIRLNAGTLVGNATSIGGVGISNNGTLVFNQTNAGISTGTISGAGNVIKNGEGRLFLTTSNTYAGGTLVNAGTLAGHAGSLRGSITNNATVEFQQVRDGTYSDVMVGTGGLLKTGASELALLGANTYSGGTVVSAGTLSGNTTSLQGAISNSGTVVFNQSTDGTYSGALSGSGALRKAGNAVLTLTGENTQGSTLVAAGTLQIGNGGATGSLGGSITNNGTLTFNRAGSLVSSGPISGTGNLNKEGIGTVTLTGSNSFKGDTVVNNGTLVLGGSNALGRASVVKVNADGTLEAAQRTIIGFLDLNGGTVIGNTNLVSSLTLINSGTVSGLADGVDFEAGILKRTAGTALVDGANTFTGTIKVEAGTMRMTNGGSFDAGSSLYLYSGATMDLNGVSQTFSAVDGAAGSVALGSGNLTVSGAETSDFGGVISGTGRLIKGGTGVMNLTGANTYTGGTEVTGGRLVGTTTSLRGAITNSATVEFDVQSDASLAANIAGAGTVVKSGSGVLSVTNAQSYTGGTTVSGGELNVNGSLNGSTVTVETGATLSGSGSVGGIVLNLGGTISPGNSIDTLGVDGNALWNPGGNYNWEIHDAAPGGAGTGWDLINITGSLNLTALTVGSEFNINLWSLESVGPDQNGEAINFDPNQSYTWTILTASGGITGFAANAFSINTAAVNGTGGFANDLAGGTFSMALGNSDRDLNLIFTTANPGPEAVPEPGTWAAAALLAGGAAFMRWRKLRDAAKNS